jgi:hypothetical protein
MKEGQFLTRSQAKEALYPGVPDWSNARLCGVVAKKLGAHVDEPTLDRWDASFRLVRIMDDVLDGDIVLPSEESFTTSDIPAACDYFRNDSDDFEGPVVMQEFFRDAQKTLRESGMTEQMRHDFATNLQDIWDQEEVVQGAPTLDALVAARCASSISQARFQADLMTDERPEIRNQVAKKLGAIWSAGSIYDLALDAKKDQEDGLVRASITQRDRAHLMASTRAFYPEVKAVLTPELIRMMAGKTVLRAVNRGGKLAFLWDGSRNEKHTPLQTKTA